MPDEAITKEGEVKTNPTPRPEPYNTGGGDVSDRINLEFRLRDLADRYTRPLSKDINPGLSEEDKEKEFNRRKTNYILLLKGLYKEIEDKGYVVDGTNLTHEAVFEKAYEQFTGYGYGQEPKKEPTVPPGTNRQPTRVAESVETVVSGDEGVNAEFPLHDPDTWMGVRREVLRRYKAPKSGGEGALKDILSSLTPRV